MPLVAGAHTFAASGDAALRQAAGIDALSTLRGVTAVNVQFARDGHTVPGIATVSALELDSNRVTGRAGPRKPIIAEIFDRLAAIAEKHRSPAFLYINADVIVSQDAVDVVLQGGRDGWLFSREDFDPGAPTPPRMVTAGVDVFALATDWWRRNRHRFRAYIAGEPVWDNVYTSIVMCHGDAVLENRRPLIRHQAHEARWTPSGGPFADYTRLLAALDAPYFSLWCEYWAQLEAVRRTGASDADERALAAEVFQWKPGTASRVRQALRAMKAHVRYSAARNR